MTQLIAAPKNNPVGAGPLNSALDPQTRMSGPVSPEEVILISRDPVEAEDIDPKLPPLADQNAATLEFHQDAISSLVVETTIK